MAGPSIIGDRYGDVQAGQLTKAANPQVGSARLGGSRESTYVGDMIARCSEDAKRLDHIVSRIRGKLDTLLGGEPHEAEVQSGQVEREPDNLIAMLQATQARTARLVQYLGNEVERLERL